MSSLSKVLLASAIAVATLGALMTVSFLVLSGLDYRAKEDAGLQGGFPPQWIVTGIESGFVVFLIGTLATLLAGIYAAVTFRRSLSRG